MCRQRQRSWRPAAMDGIVHDSFIPEFGLLQPQGIEESEVLLALIAERHERRSLGITSNLVFSERGKVFANPMAQDRASLGQTRVRPAYLPDQCGAESAGGEVVAPTRVVDARQKWLSRQLQVVVRM